MTGWLHLAEAGSEAPRAAPSSTAQQNAQQARPRKRWRSDLRGSGSRSRARAPLTLRGSSALPAGLSEISASTIGYNAIKSCAPSRAAWCERYVSDKSGQLASRRGTEPPKLSAPNSESVEIPMALFLVLAYDGTDPKARARRQAARPEHFERMAGVLGSVRRPRCASIPPGYSSGRLSIFRDPHAEHLCACRLGHSHVRWQWYSCRINISFAISVSAIEPKELATSYEVAEGYGAGHG